MTETEKEEWRQLKQSVATELRENRSWYIDHYREALIDTDERIGRYVLSIIDNHEDHNLYELLSVKRFFYLLGKYKWSKKKVLHFFKFYELLRFSGIKGRRRYKLTPVQAFQFANIFGFRMVDGRRLIRTAYIFVPRKFSKTTSSAALAVYDMLFGDNNAQSYVGANSYDQAKVCFDEIRNIMFDIDPRQKHFRINREKVSFTDVGRDSFSQCLTANARTKDGLFASLVIMDEYAQARNTAGANGADLKNTLTTSMGPRLEPLVVVISTASEVIDGPFVHELEGVKQTLRGEIENDKIFASLFMPDVDDREDDPRTWAKVQPHIGITVQPDYYANEYGNALMSAENMMAFRTKLLNIFTTNEAKDWISADVARNASVRLNLADLTTRPDGMVAIDLSESDDFSAVSVGFYNPQRRDFTFHTAYFFPEGALPGHENERLYRSWAEDGHLILTQGKVIDYRRIVEYILEVNKYVKILQIGYDPYKSTEVVNMLAAAGAKNVLVGISQTYGNFTAPVESFEHAIKTGHAYINDNPINFFCFGNAVLDYDKLENCKPLKRSHTRKIDGVVTTLMCLRLFMDYVR